MARFKISYTDDQTQEVKADNHKDERGWITFTPKLGQGTDGDPYRRVQVLRVFRIDAIDLSP